MTHCSRMPLYLFLVLAMIIIERSEEYWINHHPAEATHSQSVTICNRLIANSRLQRQAEVLTEVYNIRPDEISKPVNLWGEK